MPIADPEGGVGKTTTAVNLAAALAMRRRTTLPSDLAPKPNSSISFLDHGTIAACTTRSPIPAGELARITQPAATLQSLLVAPANVALAKL